MRAKRLEERQAEMKKCTEGSAGTAGALSAKLATVCQVVDIKTLPHNQQHYTPAYIARKWGYNIKTIYEWFEHEEGVLIKKNQASLNCRRYRSMRISESAMARVYQQRVARAV